LSSRLIAVRSHRAARDLVPEIRGVLRGIDSGIIPYEIQTGSDMVVRFTAPTRGRTVAATVFSICAMLLGTFGVFAASVEWVSAHYSEMLIRMLLGATRLGVVRRSLRESMTIGLAGVGSGVVVVWLLVWVLRSMIGTIDVDWLTLLGSAALVAILTTAAAFMASWRATARFSQDLGAMMR
jgi:ABC-type antimicrobial peptide transport system permease subunit